MKLLPDEAEVLKRNLTLTVHISRLLNLGGGGLIPFNGLQAQVRHVLSRVTSLHLLD